MVYTNFLVDFCHIFPNHCDVMPMAISFVVVSSVCTSFVPISINLTHFPHQLQQSLYPDLPSSFFKPNIPGDSTDFARAKCGYFFGFHLVMFLMLLVLLVVSVFTSDIINTWHMLSPAWRG